MKTTILTIRLVSILLFVGGAALFVGSSAAFWEGYSSVEKINREPKTEQPATSDTELERGDLIGSLLIPRLDAKIPVFHGSTEDELIKGIGHVENSKLPEENGNIVLSGHRDTVFRKLGELEVGDLLQLEMAAGIYTYKIKKIRTADEDDLTVLVPRPRETLTVTTCYPFTYIGSAPERYILEAMRIDKKVPSL
ncbi:class D sortase [Sutcliffiella deserti]|uniref:class D sortase n=1 Tax=Sutcliffiella deserti TaxID=2875501 RepID=UPI001CBCC26F|nr:class D sortase [Sutcliffiella deserti]